MNKKLSVLQNANPAMVLLEPFPHLIIYDALPQDLYNHFASCYPSSNIFGSEVNQYSNRYSWYPANQSLEYKLLHADWIKFIQYHTSKHFFLEVIQLFENPLKRLYKHVVDQAFKGTVGIRNMKEAFDFGLDCQLVYCSPVVGRPSISRDAHLDREVALYVGLFYFRNENDNSSGGDLIFYKIKNEFSTGEIKTDDGNHIKSTMVEETKRIPYKSNTLVFFLNSPNSIHGVSTRSITPYPRLHVNFLCELKNPLFKVNKSTHLNPVNNSWYGNIK